MTDHKDDINNGAFMLRNSAWGKSFVNHWLFLCSNRNKYQFTDNGPFAETVLRFGGNDLPKYSNCSYGHDHCYKEMTAKNNGKGNGKHYVECLGKTKVKLMGTWNRTEHRDMGRIRFVSTAGGFNTHGWEAWKARGGKRTRETFFMDGMFVLHNKNFMKRVSPTSATCPEVTNASADIKQFVKKQGVYMISSHGICDMDDAACKQQHFGGDPDCKVNAPKARKQPLDLMSRKGIEMRKLLMLAETEKKGKGPKLPARIVQGDNLRCGGQYPTGLSEDEVWCYALRYPDDLAGMDADALSAHWLEKGEAEGRVATCADDMMRIPRPVDGLSAFDPWAQAAARGSSSSSSSSSDGSGGGGSGSGDSGDGYSFVDPSTGEQFSAGDQNKDKTANKESTSTTATGSSEGSDEGEDGGESSGGKGDGKTKAGRPPLGRRSRMKSNAKAAAGGSETNATDSRSTKSRSGKIVKRKEAPPGFARAAVGAAREAKAIFKKRNKQDATPIRPNTPAAAAGAESGGGGGEGEPQEGGGGTDGPPTTMLKFSSDELEGLLAPQQPSADELARRARADEETTQASALAAAAEEEEEEEEEETADGAGEELVGGVVGEVNGERGGGEGSGDGGGGGAAAVAPEDLGGGEGEREEMR